MSKRFQIWSFIVAFCILFAGVEAMAEDRVVVIPLFCGGEALKNVVTVAKANGNFTDPVAAVNSISDASAANPYIVVIGPGIYSLTQTLVMKQYVDIVGSGENVTKITGAISTNDDDISSTLIFGANNATLSSLTMENTGGHWYSFALYNSNASPTISNVTAIASWASIDNYCVRNVLSSPVMTNVTAISVPSDAGKSIGVYNTSNSSPTMTNVIANASGGTDNYGIWNASSSPTMINVTATASGGSMSFGVCNRGFSSPTMTNVTATASGTGTNRGVYNSSSSPTMTQVTATASGTGTNYGISNAYTSCPTMTDVTATASGGSNNYGVYNRYESSAPTIRRSTLEGATNSLYTHSDTGCTATVSQSTFIGGVSGGANNECVACDDGSGNALDGNCN